MIGRDGGDGEVIAVDLGATHIRVALVTGQGEIRKKTVVNTPRSGSSGYVVTEAVIGCIEELIPGRDPKSSGIPSIGVSAAGPLDIGAGTVVHSPNIVFEEIPVRLPLEERFGLPVHLINDASGGAIGEAWVGAGKGRDPVVYITLSTGIGGGVVAGGHLLWGRSGNAAELGHIFVDDHFGVVCNCGNAGHWEAYASGGSLPRFFAAWWDEQGVADPGFAADSAEHIFSAAKQGNQTALEFMAALGRINARAISTLITAYDPDIIVLDGPVARFHGPLIIEMLLPFVDDYLPLPSIVTSGLEGNAPLLGAAAYALNGGQW